MSSALRRGDRSTDADAGAIEGIAVITVDNTNGAWEFSTNAGGSWTAFGAPSTSAALYNSYIWVAAPGTRVTVGSPRLGQALYARVVGCGRLR